MLLGDVPLAPYALSGTDQVPASITPLIAPDTRALLMANHGPVTFGPSLQSAYERMEVLEAYCHIALLTRSLGTAHEVPPPRAASDAPSPLEAPGGSPAGQAPMTRYEPRG